MKDTTYLDGLLNIPLRACDVGFLDRVREDYSLKVREGLFEMFYIDEEKGYLRLPRSAVDLVDSFDNRTSKGRPLTVDWNFSPRVGQAEVVNKAASLLRKVGTAQLIAFCGSGKTVMGSAVALKLGVSTCILVHKEFLASQWEEAIGLLCPTASVGRWQRDRCDDGDTFDFVIATTQSVTNAKRDYPESVYASFGLVIADEVHRYAAEVWQQAITKFPAAHRLALTATPYRSDGLWPVISAHFGEHAATLVAPKLIPKIYRINTTARFKLSAPWLSDIQKRGKLISMLTEIDGRNEIICRNIKKAFDSNRQTLVISDRRAQLTRFSELLAAYGIDDVGFYVGGKKMVDLERAADKQVILTTYQMAKEGLNIPSLSVLIMASPQAQIEQTVGRILRAHAGKGDPVVLDFVDPLVEDVYLTAKKESKIRNPFDQLWKARARQYSRLGYEIVGGRS